MSTDKGQNGAVQVADISDKKATQRTVDRFNKALDEASPETERRATLTHRKRTIWTLTKKFFTGAELPVITEQKSNLEMSDIEKAESISMDALDRRDGRKLGALEKSGNMIKAVLPKIDRKRVLGKIGNLTKTFGRVAKRGFKASRRYAASLGRWNKSRIAAKYERRAALLEKAGRADIVLAAPPPITEETLEAELSAPEDIKSEPQASSAIIINPAFAPALMPRDPNIGAEFETSSEPKPGAREKITPMAMPAIKMKFAA